MASGDAQRAWFSEMLEELGKRWHRDMAWEEVGRLCDEMQSMRDQIRADRNLKPVRMYCKVCGEYSMVTPPRISIRSMLFALSKAGIVSEEEFKELEKKWQKYRQENTLDLYGKRASILHEEAMPHSHSLPKKQSLFQRGLRTSAYGNHNEHETFRQDC